MAAEAVAGEGAAHAPTAGEYIIHHLQHLQNQHQHGVVDFSVVNLDSTFFTIVVRVFRDKTASSVPVGMLYEDIYHTVLVAPATSNTVAKCAFGISDSLPTNMFAQAGKLGIPGIVFACDTEPVVVTRSPHDWVTLRPRRIELENVERLRGIEFCRVVSSPEALEAALDARLKELQLAWNTSSS